jgi:hypothetical protein
MCECGVPAGALNLNSTGYPDHGRYGDLPLQRKIPTTEPVIEPRTSGLVVRSSDHQATGQIHSQYTIIIVFPQQDQLFERVSMLPLHVISCLLRL